MGSLPLNSPVMVLKASFTLSFRLPVLCPLLFIAIMQAKFAAILIGLNKKGKDISLVLRSGRKLV